jgi:5-methyltetrahydrofolate--homocysteine methyltransferase
MTRIDLSRRIREGLFLLDGAMGTELFARGVEVGRCSDGLNIDSADIVFDVHRAYFRAGSDAVLTNSFGANRYALGRHGFADKVMDINTAASRIARRAAGEEKYVLGDIGPSGDFLQPLGVLEPEQLKQAFAEQAQGLLEGQVDGFIIETMTALDELAIAIEAVKSVCGRLPVFASMAFDRRGGGFKTMMGVDVKSAVSAMVSAGADAVGFNCGTASLDEYVQLAQEYVKASEKTPATGGQRPATIFAEPNAGKPQLVDGKATYNVSPADFAAMAGKIHSAGVNIIGGCCGTSPAHIEALAKKLRG